MVEVVGWGKTNNGRRLREATPCVVVSSSRPRFDELPIHSPFSFACVQVLRPPGLIVFFFSKKKKKSLFYFIFFLLPNPIVSSRALGGLSSSIKAILLFLFLPRFFLNKNVMVIALVDTKKRKKKKFLAQTIFPTVSCACARVKQCVRSFVSDWKKKKN